MANAIAPLLLIFFLIFGGFYINNDSIPVYFIWMKYWSFIRYGYEALVVNEFDGVTFTGPMNSVLPGSQIIAQFGMDVDMKVVKMWFCIGVVCSLFRL
jgi:ABC-type multidrug transport system permease subunit